MADLLPPAVRVVLEGHARADPPAQGGRAPQARDERHQRPGRFCTVGQDPAAA